MKRKTRLPAVEVVPEEAEAHRRELGDVLAFGALADLPVKGLLNYAGTDANRLSLTELVLTGAKRADAETATLRGTVRILDAARAKGDAEYDAALLALVRAAVEGPERFIRLVGMGGRDGEP